MAEGGAQRSGGGGCLGWSAFAVLMAGSMVFLTVFLVRECTAGSDAITAYAASIRHGADVSPEVGGSDAATLTETLRRSRSITVLNFIAQGGTACYWVHVSGERGTEARFLLAERDDGMQVLRASLTHDCDCPDDEQSACHME